VELALSKLPGDELFYFSGSCLFPSSLIYSATSFFGGRPTFLGFYSGKGFEKA